MMSSLEQVLPLAKQVAIEAVRAAGRIAKEKFNTRLHVEEKDDFGDLVTEADHEAERAILERIREHFPGHEIRSEESGWSGLAGDWLWLVDPLDGTNNYAVGLPVYGVAVTLMYRREPVLGVIYEPLTDKLYVAVRGQGASCNGESIRVKRRAEPHKLTVGWIQGHQVRKQPDALAIKAELDLRFKRVLRLWAPTLQWSMLARGDMDAIVLFNSEGDDLYAGVLLAKEAGASVVEFNGRDFLGMNEEPYLIACHPEHRAFFLDLIESIVPLRREKKPLAPDVDRFCLVQLPVVDLTRSVDFYRNLLGFVLEHPERPIREHTFLRAAGGGGPGLHLLETPEKEFRTNHWTIHGKPVHAAEMHSKNIAELQERLREVDAVIVETVHYTSCGGYLKFLDPDGHLICVNQDVRFCD